LSCQDTTIFITAPIPDHYNFNLGNNFTFWDRLFGTYLDPDTLDPKEIALGIGERPNALRLIAGL